MTWPAHIQALIQHEGYDWLSTQAREMESVVEVGCWHGAGTFALCTTCPGLVYAVDHWQGSPDHSDATHGPQYDVYARFLENVGHFANLRILKMPSAEAAKQFVPKSIDMVVIDAGHDRVSIETDLAAWVPKAKRLICGHDWGHVPVREALLGLKRPIDHHCADIWSISLDGFLPVPVDPRISETRSTPDHDGVVQHILEGVR